MGFVEAIGQRAVATPDDTLKAFSTVETSTQQDLAATARTMTNFFTPKHVVDDWNVFAEEVRDLPTAEKIAAYTGRLLFSAQTAGLATDPATKMVRNNMALSKEDYKNDPDLFRPDVPWEKGTTRAMFAFRAQEHDQSMIDRGLIRHGSDSWPMVLARFGVGMAVIAPDPVNYIGGGLGRLKFIPNLGPMARATIGRGIEGAVANAAVDAILYPRLKAKGVPFDAVDVTMDILLGGGFGSVFGRFEGRARVKNMAVQALRQEAQNKAIKVHAEQISGVLEAGEIRRAELGGQIESVRAADRVRRAEHIQSGATIDPPPEFAPTRSGGEMFEGDSIVVKFLDAKLAKARKELSGITGELGATPTKVPPGTEIPRGTINLLDLYGGSKTQIIDESRRAILSVADALRKRGGDLTPVMRVRASALERELRAAASRPEAMEAYLIANRGGLMEGSDTIFDRLQAKSEARINPDDVDPNFTPPDEAAVTREEIVAQIKAAEDASPFEPRVIEAEVEAKTGDAPKVGEAKVADKDPVKAAERAGVAITDEDKALLNDLTGDIEASRADNEFLLKLLGCE